MGSTSDRWSFGQASEWGRPPLDRGLRTAVTGQLPAFSRSPVPVSRVLWGASYINCPRAHPPASAPVYPRLCRSRLHLLHGPPSPILLSTYTKNDVQEPLRPRRRRRPRRCQRPGRDLERAPDLHLGHLRLHPHLHRDGRRTARLHCVSSIPPSRTASLLMPSDASHSSTDVNCLCTNTALQQASLSCLQSTCSSDELAAALALQSQECAAGTSPSALHLLPTSH